MAEFGGRPRGPNHKLSLAQIVLLYTQFYFLGAKLSYTRRGQAGRSGLLLCAFVVCAAMFCMAFQIPPPIAERAHKILESKCAECHHEGGIGAAQLKIENFSDVMASGFLISKDGTKSKLLDQVEQGLM